MLKLRMALRTTIAAYAVVEHEAVTGAVHRFQAESRTLHVEGEHVLQVVLGVAYETYKVFAQYILGHGIIARCTAFTTSNDPVCSPEMRHRSMLYMLGVTTSE